jgi:hypothetical protein
MYGQLNGSEATGQSIKLYHRVNPSRHYSLIGRTTTDSFGFYEFTRAEGVVYTNRSWFVRAPDATHSRTVYERVAALVSLLASQTTADTSQPIVFSGHVTPNHAFERVLLQVRRGTGDEGMTVASATLGRSSDYSLAHCWRIAGERFVRVVFPGDQRNIRSASDPLSITIEQHQVPDFTINSSPAGIEVGSSATIPGSCSSRAAQLPSTTLQSLSVDDRLISRCSHVTLPGLRLATEATASASGRFTTKCTS